MKKKLKKFIVSFSYGERRKKEYEEYQKKRDSLKAMPKEERWKMLNKRKICEFCKKLLNMISDSMLHFFVAYVVLTGSVTLYYVQYGILEYIETIKEQYFDYTISIAPLVWIVVFIVFMWHMKFAKAFTSLALCFLQIFLSVVQKSHKLWFSFFLPDTIFIYVIIFLIIRGLTKLDDSEYAEK